MTDALPTAPASRDLTEIATWSDYASAQAAVDRLSDARFPVEHTQIVGHDITTVEQVTGRPTLGRAALYGAGSGAWFGLFVGLLLGIFSALGAFLGLLLFGLVIGAVWGAVFGLVAHSATGGRRDFSSSRGIAAGRYSLMVERSVAQDAARILGTD